MLEIYLPKEFDDYVTNGFLRLTEDVILHITDAVELTQITLGDAVDSLIITGNGSLKVDARGEGGIAIGNNGSFGLSFGRWTLPRKTSKIAIDVRSITTYCDIEGCGIGSYGLYAIKSTDFTENCTIRNTPIDRHILLEHLEGSTKYTKRPQYLTDEEYNKMKSEEQSRIDDMFLRDKIIWSVIDKLRPICEKGDRKEANEFMLKFGLKYIDRSHRGNFVESLQAMTATFLEAIPMFDPDGRSRLLVHLVYIYAAIMESKLYGKILMLPLSMRYLSCIMDMYSDYRLFEQMDPDLITDCHDLGLPEDNPYYLTGCEKELSRNLYGLFQIANYADDYNYSIVPNIEIRDGMLVTNFYLHTVLDTYVSDQYKGLVFCTYRAGDGDGALWIGDNEDGIHDYALPMDDRISVNTFIKFLSDKEIMNGLCYINYMNKRTCYVNVLDIPSR